jgi:hypothetical protein
MDPTASLPNANDDDRPVRISWPVVLAVFTAAGLLRFTYLYLDDVARGVPATIVHRLLEEATGAYAAMLLFPVIAAVERANPLTNGRWRERWLVHLATFLGYSAAHTTLLALGRRWLFSLFGLGPYDYGWMPARYLMEAPQDLISYCGFIGVLSFLRVQRLLREREVRATALERDAATARLEALSLRLQPHFLFNALNTIASTVYVNPVVADTMIGRLGDLLRRALRASDRQEIPVREELETLHAYMTFVEARFGDRLRCSLRIDDAARDLAIPALLLQPLVENAVRHGASVEYGHSEILIEVSRRGDRLEIVVENDVEEAPQTEPHVGTGLGATRDRLKLLYRGHAALETSTRDRRFRVRISIPASTASGDEANVQRPPDEGHEKPLWSEDDARAHR